MPVQVPITTGPIQFPAHAPKCLGSITHVGDMEASPGSALAADAMQGNKPAEGKSLFFCNYAFKINHGTVSISQTF